MKKIALASIFILLSSLGFSYPPHINVIVPEILTKNIPILQVEKSKKNHHRIHAISVEVMEGIPNEGWRLYMHMDKVVTYALGELKSSSFPLYWRLSDTDDEFARIHASKTLLAESIPGYAKTYLIEIALDSSWDLEPGDYLTSLNFTLEPII